MIFNQSKQVEKQNSVVEALMEVNTAPCRENWEATCQDKLSWNVWMTSMCSNNKQQMFLKDVQKVESLRGALFMGGLTFSS